MRPTAALPVLLALWICIPLRAAPGKLRIEEGPGGESLLVLGEASPDPVLVQHAPAGGLPWIRAGDFEILHAHTRLSGRDFLAGRGGDHWERQSSEVVAAAGPRVSWETAYRLLGADGEVLMLQTLSFQLESLEGGLALDVEWSGQARQDVRIGDDDRGGLMVRDLSGAPLEIANAARQRNGRADGQPAMWASLARSAPGEEPLHLALFDHPGNPGFPQRWQAAGRRLGPVRALGGAWSLDRGDATLVRHRIRIQRGAWTNASITEEWSRFSGLGGTWALWGIAQRDGLQAEFLDPEQSAGIMTLPEGFRAGVYAAEPQITQPMAFCWDHRGRMWVAENRDYESRGRGFANSGDSRVLILEDTDGDGKADVRKVFCEGIPFPAAIAVGLGGLWLGAPPNLLFLPDRDGDDRADEEDIEIRLTGWGIRDRHETLNSLHWGPDGWLYGCQGFATPSTVGRPRAGARLPEAGDPFPGLEALEGPGTEINGGVWRYHPYKDRFEVVAHGFSNPWGIDYDAKGQLFITACVIPHLWHVIPGGIYHRQGGRHFNPHVYSDIGTIADHRHRSAHGGARIYLSDAFPPRYRDRIFMANIHEHAVLVDSLEPNGSGFRGTHYEDFLLANNAQWIGFSMEIGPEGGIYVLDWHDADICGKDVLNKETGRIFRIVPERSLAEDWPGRYADLSRLSDSRLVGMQTRPSAWHARQARLQLQHRAHQGSLEEGSRRQLRDLLENGSDGDHRLRALWGLHLTGGLPEEDLLGLLEDPDAHLRAWSVQLLCEDMAPSSRARAAFARMAADDPSPVVRLYLASALQRMPHGHRWPVLEALVGHAGDSGDHNLPKMIWFATEPLVAAHPNRIWRLAALCRLPWVQQCIARRLADEGDWEALAEGLAGLDAPLEPAFLEGFLKGIEAVPDARPPQAWEALYARLRNSPSEPVARLATDIAQHFGDVAASRAMMRTLENPEEGAEARLQALRGLAIRKWRELPRLLPGMLDSPDLRLEAIRAMGAFDSGSLASLLLERYGQFDPDERLAALQTLSTRPGSGRELTSAIARGDIPRQDIPAWIARQLRRVVGNGFVEVWGSVEQLSAEKRAAMARFRNLLTEEALEAADPSRGRALFEAACGVCHVMYQSGREVGPDITGADRQNLDYLLGNIVDPSADIQDDYRMVMVATQDGRSLAGNIVNQSDRQITLRTIGQDIVLDRSEILSQEVARVSLMPERLLEQLSDEQVLDLIAYLRTDAQVPLP